MSHPSHQTPSKVQRGQPDASDGKPKKGEVAKVWGLGVTIEQIGSSVVEAEKYLKGLSMQQAIQGQAEGPNKPKQKPGHSR